MTQIAIQAQVDAIKKVTQEALQSKEAALKFLVDAGIERAEPTQNKQSHTKSGKRNK